MEQKEVIERELTDKLRLTERQTTTNNKTAYDNHVAKVGERYDNMAVIACWRGHRPIRDEVPFQNTFGSDR